MRTVRVSKSMLATRLLAQIQYGCRRSRPPVHGFMPSFVDDTVLCQNCLMRGLLTYITKVEEITNPERCSKEMKHHWAWCHKSKWRT